MSEPKWPRTHAGKIGSGVLLAAAMLALGSSAHAAEEAKINSAVVPTPLMANSAAVSALPSAMGAGVALAARPSQPDGCISGEVAANATRPAWDYAASTTQCGVAETDSGLELQPMGSGVQQRMLVSSIRYGLTPRLDLRWGFTEHMTQSGGGATPLQGIGDQWLSARYRFYEQGRRMPAMALLYAVKVPTANPAKGFGTGFVDHQLIFIASRDLGKYHFDFNTVGTIVGGAQAHDGAVQFGLAVTRPLSPKLSVILESYGGPQPGTADRFGAAFAGATYALRPTLVFDAAYSQTYTAGSPRSQTMAGFTYAIRPGFGQLPRNALTRLLGR